MADVPPDLQQYGPWGAAIVALAVMFRNLMPATRKDVAALDRRLDEIVRDVGETNERVARIEGAMGRKDE